MKAGDISIDNRLIMTGLNVDSKGRCLISLREAGSPNLTIYTIAFQSGECSSRVLNPMSCLPDDVECAFP